MKTLSDLDTWLAAAPAGTLLTAQTVREMIAPLASESRQDDREAVEPAETLATWRERLWTAPAETRIGVKEVAEAVGRSASWIYKHTSTKAVEESEASPLPYRKLEGELVFVVGEIRAWIRDSEDVLRGGRMDSPAAQRSTFRIA